MIPSLPKGFVLWSKQYRYTIKDVIGRGSYGIVYLAELHSDVKNYTCDVALKEFAPVNLCTRQQDMSISLDPLTWTWGFVDEYHTLSRIDHYNVVCVYEHIYTNGTQYYAMEYLRGGTLGDYLRQSGKMSEKRAIYFIKQIASGLEAFHQMGTAFIDLKLNNLVLRGDDCVVLIDGGSHLLPKSNLLVDRVHDIYALACVFLCLISGEVVPRPEHDSMLLLFATSQRQGLLSAAAAKTIQLALDSQFQDVTEFCHALEGINTTPFTNSRISRRVINPATSVDPFIAQAFLNKMRRMSDFYITTYSVEPEVSSGSYDLQELVVAANQWAKNVQQGFVLGLRLPTPDEFSVLIQTGECDSGTFLAFEPQEMKFYEIIIDVEIAIDGSGGRVDSCEMVAKKPLHETWCIDHLERYRFFYACDLNPLMPSSTSLHPFAEETQVPFDAILPASIFGFCPVVVNGKWGMASNLNWCESEIPCKYDQITNVEYVALPGGYMHYFLGVIATVGEQIDVYELTADSHLRLKHSMTIDGWRRRSTFT